MACAFAFLLLVATTIPSTQSLVRQASSDGVPFGEPSKATTKPVSLSIIGAALGATPDVLIGTKACYSAAASPDKVANLLGNMANSAFVKSEFFVPGIPPADVVGFSVAKGRIWRIVLYFRDISGDKLADLTLHWNEQAAASRPLIRVMSEFPDQVDHRIGVTSFDYGPMIAPVDSQGRDQ